MDIKITALILGFLALFSGAAFLFLHKTSQKSAQPNLEGISPELYNKFEAWRMKFQKYYDTEDHATYRLHVFSNTLQRIEATNKNPKNTYTAGLNQFSDQTLDELKLRVLMIKKVPTTNQATFRNPGTPVASSIDWRTQGAVTAVKDQGQCGSCWSFSTTGVLEGTDFLFTGKKTLRSFAEQQLVDCCGKEGFQCEGCSGAWPEWAVNYVISKGITTEDKYQYTAMEGQCRDSQVGKAFTVSKFEMIAAGNETDLVAAVNIQPVSICADASSWFDYSSGVFNGCTPNPGLDHAILLVGYTNAYYIVKNSWATSWGEQGYIRLPRNGSNPCGIANHALTTTI